MRATFSRRDVWLVLSGFLGPTAWFALLVASYYVVPGAHEAGRTGWLYLLHAVAAVLAVASGSIALREVRVGGDLSDRFIQRRRAMAIGGLALSVLSFLLVIGSLIPVMMLPPGAEP